MGKRYSGRHEFGIFQQKRRYSYIYEYINEYIYAISGANAKLPKMVGGREQWREITDHFLTKVKNHLDTGKEGLWHMSLNYMEEKTHL